MEFSSDGTTKGANQRLRKLLGRAYLRENRISEALEVYLGILRDTPNDVDVLLVLGNLYRLSGQPDAAECLYQRVLERSRSERATEKQASLLPVEPLPEWSLQEVLSEQAIQALSQRLLACSTPILMEKIRTAADSREGTLENLTVEDRLSDPAGPGGEDVQQLLPALIALNVRQARAAGYPDLAEALQSLQINLTRHADDRWADDLLRDDRMLGSIPGESE